MNKNFILLLFMTLFVIVLSAVEIMILHTNDHHGNPFSYQKGEFEVAGLAERAFIINQFTEGKENFLILDAGDINTGRPESMIFDAEPDIIAYNLIGYDAMAIGNHEFYAGLERLKKQKKWANFPFLSANILLTEQESAGVPYVIKSMPNGLKIAIFGLTTTTIKRSMPALANQLIVNDEVETAKALVPILKEKADIVIALTHLGIYEDTEPDFFGSIRLAQEVQGIDLIIDGHSHSVLEKPLYINNTPIIQAGDRGKYLGKAMLRFDTNTKNVKLSEWESIPLFRRRNEPAFGIDKEVFDALQVFKDKVFKQLNQIVGKSDKLYSVANIRRELSPLGQVIADAMMFAVRSEMPDLGISNGGGIRADIPQGDIRLFNVYDILPFDNTVVIAEISGETLLEVVNFSMSKMRNTGGFLQFSSNTEVFESDGKWLIKVNGKDIQTDKDYKIALNSYIAGGGDNYSHFKTAKRIENSEIIDKIALSEYIKLSKEFQIKE